MGDLSGFCGGYIRSVTPTNVTLSGFLGGYTARYLSFPGISPNTCSSGLTSLLQDNFCSFWAFNNPSGTIRQDLKNRNDAIPQPYKKRFRGDKDPLNNGAVSYFDMEEHKKTGRMDSFGTNHLLEVVGDVPKVIGLVGNAGSGAIGDGSVFLTKSNPNRVNPGSGDFTILTWFRQDSGPTVIQGMVSKWSTATSQAEWSLDIINTNNAIVPLQGRPRFIISIDGPGTNTLTVAASGVDIGSNTPSAPEILFGESYFVVARVRAASGQTDITWASGTDFSSRFVNFSDVLSDITTSGIFQGTAPLEVLNVEFTTDRRFEGVLSSVGIYNRYLPDSELELMFGSGLGQHPKSVNDATVITTDPDPLGPGSVSGHVIPAQSGVGFGFGGGGGLPGRVGPNPRAERLIIPHTNGDDLDFDGSTSFTFAGWVRFPDTNTRMIFSKTIEVNGDRAYRLYRSNADGRLKWEISNAAGTSFTIITSAASPGFINADQDYFVVCGWDENAAEMFLQVDNSTVVTGAKSAGDFGRSVVAFMFGDGNFTFDNFNSLTGGRLDAWGFWKRILNSGEITTLFNNGDGLDINQDNLDTCFFDPAFEDFVPKQNKIGGLLFSKVSPDSRDNNFFGGYIEAPGDGKSEGIGGFIFAQPFSPVPPVFIGGFASGLFESDPARIGGWTFGRPPDTQFIEQHSRTLVKVRSEDVVDQGLNLDAQIRLQQRDNEEFNAKLIMFETAPGAQFNANLNIEAFKIFPSSAGEIICVGPDSSGITQVTISASGFNFEPGTFFTSAEIDFGEPYGFGGVFGGGGISNPTINNSISGFNFDFLQASGDIISAHHDYKYPGRYIITTKFIDNLGQHHMQGFVMDNISSGSIASVSGDPIEGTHYPAIEISGTPRIGLIPPTLFIDYDMRASGTADASGIIPAPVGAAVARLNKTTPTTEQFLNWNFGNDNFSTIKQSFSNYPNPGVFIPVVRFQFIHPSGELLAPSGGPPNGSGQLFGPKPIWTSDSLSVGFGQ